MKYFGDPALKKDYEEQVETPVGVPCLWCEELIEEGDIGTFQAVVSSDSEMCLLPMHYECQIRAAAGSVGHQKGLCSCYGGTEEDPPGMTKHEAAIAAAKYFHFHS